MRNNYTACTAMSGAGFLFISFQKCLFSGLFKQSSGISIQFIQRKLF